MYYVNYIAVFTVDIAGLGGMMRAALLWSLWLGVLAASTSRPTGAQEPAGPVLRGRVLSDSADAPIAGAILGLPGFGLIVQSDSLGNFVFPGRMPTRLILIRVTALGFKPIDTSVELTAPDTADVDFIMSKSAQLLGAVRVGASRVERRFAEFERRRSVGAGTFFTDSIIRRYARAGRVSTLISSRSQLRVVGAPRGVGTEQFVIGARGSELSFGGARPCYAAVLLDGSWVYSGQSGEPPFNINGIAAENVAAMEVYRSSTDIPVEFRRIGNFCGLVVLWLK